MVPVVPGKTSCMAQEAAHDRDETELERDDRNLVELLQEVRVVQTGVQILFGFLLTVAFQPKFEKLSSFQRPTTSERWSPPRRR